MTGGTSACSVKYDQAGDSNYSAAPQVTETVNAQKADQTIPVTTSAPASAVYLDSFGVAASAPGGTVTFSSGGVCSNNNASFTMTAGTGTCSVKYDQAGNANYNAAPRSAERGAGQECRYRRTPHHYKQKSAVYQEDFTVSATAPGGRNQIHHNRLR